MKILLIGSGGREHALAHALARSPSLAKLFAAPGNPGIARHAACVTLDIGDHGAVLDFCRKEGIDLVVIGPEGPLVAGLVDDLSSGGILAFGPSRAAAQLEGSKGFTKDLCRERGIPTAAYERFTSSAAAKAYVDRKGTPIVVKADGLAAGKGVAVAQTLTQAHEAIETFLKDGGAIVVEDFLDGEEASFFALCDGVNAMPLASAQDHKRAFDGDRGPNTGGMGAYSPAPVLTPALERGVMDRIVTPTVAAMAARGTPFRGVLYAGLMITEDGPKLIEYNVRFGDPETQALMLRLDSDIVPALLAAARGDLRGLALRWKAEAALCVVMAGRGYPDAVQKGSVIRGLDRAEAVAGVTIFHAATRREGEALIADGGRVLGIAATGPSILEAQARAYKAIEAIDWPEGFCRRDIGWRAILR